MSIKKTREAKRLIEEMAPQGEFLAFINPKEAGILRAMGGSGKITSMGIPSFTEDEEDTGDVSNPGGGFSGDTSPAGDDQEDDVARMMADMGLTGPGFTSRGGGEDPPSLVDRILGRTTTGINTLKDRLGDRFTRTKNYLTDPTNLKNMATSALLTSFLGPIGLVLSGIGRTQQFQDFLTNLKDKPDEIENIENTELRTFKPNPNFMFPEIKPIQPGASPFPDISNLVADVSQKDLDFNKARGSKMLDLDTFKSITDNPTLTQQELDAIRDGTITAPTGKFAV
jgi:hypothetical protein